jgi:hypothetical protein
MRGVLVAAIVLTALTGDAAAGPSDGIKLATWNIQTLATPGRKVFDTSAERKQADYEDLRVVEQSLNADVYALQEISSPAAAALVFPPAEFTICITGQWHADEKKLGPIYDFAAIEAQGIKPTCFDDANKPLPDTAVTANLEPGKPDPLLAQYTAIAVRKSSGIKIDEVADLARLGVPQNDKGEQPGTFTVRNVRWGLDATLSKGGEKFHLLAVHMKSGCFDGFLKKEWWAATQDAWQQEPKRDHPCEVYARQLPALRTWLMARKASGDDFIVAGDLNRRLDLELLDKTDPDLWPIITGSQTSETADDIALTHIPRDETVETGKACWSGRPPAENVAIDFFVLSPGTEPSDWQTRVRKVFFTETHRPDGTPVSEPGLDPAIEASRLSDHCPRVLSF